ncbi:MAG TPA: amylo-alpha-1,6-glucosidase [Gemmataceae bacterium]|nr:amylo-alpha-1,6-glucosidase [Gemmataceae bacterium]
MTADRPAGAEPKRRRAPRRGAGEENPFYIQATSPQADEQNRVLKQGDTFAVFNHYGDITPLGLGEEGLYHEGTRYLSCLLLSLGKERPLFLSSTVKEDNDLLAVDLTNADVTRDSRVIVPRGTLHLFRSKFLWQGVCYERLRLRNYGLEPVSYSLGFHFEADFADIFEVRGTKRARTGHHLDGAVEAGCAVLAYEGLDQVVRRTRLLFAPAPAALDEAEARYELSLKPQEEATFYLTVSCERGGSPPRVLAYDQALAQAGSALEAEQGHGAGVWTASEQFNAWVNRSAADLLMMTSDTAEGPYPYAGVPWFSTEFGRDGIITALECLWLNPNLARGVLGYLAAMQATEVNPEQDAEPGKILHETRRGEMAALKEVPFGRYYGSIDSTPLFVLLAGAYYERTGDRAFIESLWPNLERAVRWIDDYGDRDGDGFVEYARHSLTGLVQQGWKDSQDSVFHADGTLAEPPIALCEVQAYVYGAKRAMADLAAVLGQPGRADELRRQAADLQRRFEEAFWCEDLSTYALALDGKKRPCRVRTSNAGHCLLTGIAAPEHARRTAQTLLGHESFSGWGVRTLAATEVRYNPMSYHNGSVWPHDNALIGAGLARYGLKDSVLGVLTGLFDASLFVDLHRMPELFCGFVRRPREGPTLYPVACAPQAWAAAAVFMLLQSALGLSINAPEARICFHYPLLPPFLKEVQVRNLRVGEAVVDLLLLRYGQDVGINVPRREGRVEIVMIR